MAYYTSTFTLKTWEQFLAAGGRTSGFPDGSLSRARQVLPGDRLLCYVSGALRWIAVLEVEGKVYEDRNEKTRIWEGSYPIRFPVRIVKSVDPLHGPLVVEMLDQLDVFRALPLREQKWGLAFKRSLERWSDADGRRVEESLEEASRTRVEHPLPPGAFVRGDPIQLVDSSSGVGVTIPEDEKEENGAREGTEHTHIQYVLAQMGSAMGFSIYIPPEDRKRAWKGAAVGSIPNVVSDVALALSDAALKTIKHIDVLWIQKGTVVAAFEVESTTSIYSGLLRMSDLTAEASNLNVECFLVAHDDRQATVLEQLQRPTFQNRERPLADYCHYIPFSAVLKEEAERSKFWSFVRGADPAVEYLMSLTADL